jgi:hypothetical protein
MIFEKFYSIHPKNSFLEKLSHVNSIGAEILAEPKLWSRYEHGHDDNSVESRIIKVKLLFLAKLGAALNSIKDNDDELYYGLKNIIGEMPYSLSIFDEWWEITRYAGLDETIKYGESNVSLEELKLAKFTGFQEIDEWLTETRNSKEENSTG